MSPMSRVGVALLFATAAPVALAGNPVPAAQPSKSTTPSNSVCETRANNSTSKLTQCITRDSLWRHMVALQKIADDNPGPDGHPSRNLGEPGYLASVNYVAGLMRKAGYKVTIQEYTFPYFNFTALPSFAEVSPTPNSYALQTDWKAAYYSGSGNVTAQIQPVGGTIIPASPDPSSTSGCSPDDFAGFIPGNIALVQRGWCNNYYKAHYAQDAGAVGVIIFNEGNPGRTDVFSPFLNGWEPLIIPVVGATYEVGADLYAEYNAAENPVVHLDVQTVQDFNRLDYNLIADAPNGDPNNVVVVDAHLDAVFGAGMLDNASGSATILEVALKMAHTKTRNQLRYVWFGGEELGLFGSENYAFGLSPEDSQKIVFDIDSDVTATPNYVTAIADPAGSYNAPDFPPNVVPASQVGNNYFVEYFKQTAQPYVLWSNDGTDSWSFSWIGVPNTGILTGQDCCKDQYLVDLFGGYLGNYEGNIPSYDGGVVDRAFLWGDNLANNDPRVLETTSKAFAYVVYKLANDPTLTANKGLAAPLGPYRPAKQPGARGKRSLGDIR